MTTTAETNVSSATTAPKKKKIATKQRAGSRSSTSKLRKESAGKPKASVAASETPRKVREKSQKQSKSGRIGATGTTSRTPSEADYDLTPRQEDKLLDLLNRGTARDLTGINGIATTRAEAIIKARPFQKIQEITRVPGVGKATFSRILEYGKSLTASKS